MPRGRPNCHYDDNGSVLFAVDAIKINQHMHKKTAAREAAVFTIYFTRNFPTNSCSSPAMTLSDSEEFEISSIERCWSAVDCEVRLS